MCRVTSTQSEAIASGHGTLASRDTPRLGAAGRCRASEPHAAQTRVSPPGERVGGQAKPAEEKAKLSFCSIRSVQNSADTSLHQAAKSVGKTALREGQEVNEQKIFFWDL